MTNNGHVTTWSNVHVTWWMVPATLSHRPVKFGCHRCCWSADISFLIFHLTTWSKDCVTWRVGSSNLKFLFCQIWRLLVLWKCSKVRFFICHVTTSSKGHVNNWAVYPTVSYHCVKFGSHRHCESADMFFLFVTWLSGSGLPTVSYHFASLVAIGIVEVQIYIFFMCHMTT